MRTSVPFVPLAAALASCDAYLSVGMVEPEQPVQAWSSTTIIVEVEARGPSPEQPQAQRFTFVSVFATDQLLFPPLSDSATLEGCTVEPGFESIVHGAPRDMRDEPSPVASSGDRSLSLQWNRKAGAFQGVFLPPLPPGAALSVAFDDEGSLLPASEIDLRVPEEAMPLPASVARDAEGAVSLSFPASAGYGEVAVRHYIEGARPEPALELRCPLDLAVGDLQLDAAAFEHAIQQYDLEEARRESSGVTGAPRHGLSLLVNAPLEVSEAQPQPDGSTLMTLSKRRDVFVLVD